MNIGMPIAGFQAAPEVVWKHIDGPMLCWACHIHWLTIRERFSLWVGFTTIEIIAQKHWPQRKEFAS